MIRSWNWHDKEEDYGDRFSWVSVSSKRKGMFSLIGWVNFNGECRSINRSSRYCKKIDDSLLSMKRLGRNWTDIRLRK